MRTSLKKQYAKALAASGQVDGLSDFPAPAPLPVRLWQGEHVCCRGDKAAQLEQIHEGQITDGGDKPDPVRINIVFHDALSGRSQRRYDQGIRTTTRKLGLLDFWQRIALTEE